MSKQYAHLHAMAKTSVKFQNDWPKTVGGVSLTNQLLTNRQMDERTGHSTPISHLRTNAGVIKMRHNIRKCAASEDSDQPAHSHGQIKIFTTGHKISQGCKVSFCRKYSDQTALMHRLI